ncbi:hypothetical protein pipiens_005753 [Culex pipiens pipiens]|uniref:Uncharacterized protein n=1 Tax=Culex pipiens pipiens TaxID=38569 RepID=A0ABD1DUS7_CULPP
MKCDANEVKNNSSRLPRNNVRCRTQQAGCSVASPGPPRLAKSSSHSERYVACQKRLNKYHFFRNFNNKLASHQIDSLKALIDALPHDYRSKPVDHEFVQEKQWGFWELDHKSAQAPSADAKTKPAPRTLLISFRLTGIIPNGSRPLRQPLTNRQKHPHHSRTTGKPVWYALYIIEAIILGGIDVHTFPMAKRSALCTKFATALNRSLCHLSTNSVRPVPVRAKQLYALHAQERHQGYG